MSSVHILANPVLATEYADYAKDRLVDFVTHFIKLYGKEFVTYNVHAVIHLPNDVKNYGNLDKFSAFPFENFLGQIKKLVRKPSSVLPQVIRRLKELHSLTTAVIQADWHNKLKAEHTLGPVPHGYLPCTQFTHVHMADYMISRCSGDNCIKVNNRIGVVQNILKRDANIHVVYKIFRSQNSLFKYPFDSKFLSIFKVTELTENLHVCELTDIHGKCVLLPVNASYAAMPLIHCK